MPMLRISVQDNSPQIHGSPAALVPTLRHALSLDHGPIKIMIHGFKYLPGRPGFCPHDGIFSRIPPDTLRGKISWPRHLGLRGQSGEGLGISFGWASRGSIWNAHKAAQIAGDALATLLNTIKMLTPDRPIQLIGHSLGARVALRAIHKSDPGSVSHAILMAAAEYSSVAGQALTTSAGKQVQVLNVSSRENDIFDFLLERVISRPAPNDRMLGHGSITLPNIATLQLDDRRSLKALQKARFPIAHPQRRICHWSPYLRPGVFPLYRAFLNGDMPVGQLRALLPGDSEPRWSRFRLNRWSGKSNQSVLHLN